jgi:L-proline amide hydrolase
MGMIPEREGRVPFRGYHTWYRILGDLTEVSAGRFPVLLLHGGPGLSHRTLLPLETLTTTGRSVIFYDQLGSGNSDRPADLSLFNVDFFLDELAAVREALGLERIHLLGHSWGGMLGMEYALTQPSGLLSLILHSTGALSSLVYETRRRAYETLPPRCATRCAGTRRPAR